MNGNWLTHLIAAWLQKKLAEYAERDNISSRESDAVDDFIDFIYCGD